MKSQAPEVFRREEGQKAMTMNEHVTDSHVDDVLASIRRLVADEMSESPTISIPLVRQLRQASQKLVLQPEARVEVEAPLRLTMPVSLAAPPSEGAKDPEAARRLASLETLFAAHKQRDGVAAEQEAPPAVPEDLEAPFIEVNAPEPEQIAWTEPNLDLPRGGVQDIIRDVLREELQGEMGERITRSLRKMVRAEIARALALRDAKAE